MRSKRLSWLNCAVTLLPNNQPAPRWNKYSNISFILSFFLTSFTSLYFFYPTLSVLHGMLKLPFSLLNLKLTWLTAQVSISSGSDHIKSNKKTSFKKIRAALYLQIKIKISKYTTKRALVRNFLIALQNTYLRSWESEINHGTKTRLRQLQTNALRKIIYLIDSRNIRRKTTVHTQHASVNYLSR